jgi:L-fucose isomerase-like protein
VSASRPDEHPKRGEGSFMTANHRKMTMGVIVGNRGFFPDHLANSGRQEILRALENAGMDVVALDPNQSKYGAVETREESRLCAELFSRNRSRIDGVIVTLPNFGEDRAIADALRLADLRVPVLIRWNASWAQFACVPTNGWMRSQSISTTSLDAERSRLFNGSSLRTFCAWA